MIAGSFTVKFDMMDSITEGSILLPRGVERGISLSTGVEGTANADRELKAAAALNDPLFKGLSGNLIFFLPMPSSKLFSPLESFSVILIFFTGGTETTEGAVA